MVQFGDCKYVYFGSWLVLGRVRAQDCVGKDLSVQPGQPGAPQCHTKEADDQCSYNYYVLDAGTGIQCWINNGFCVSKTFCALPPATTTTTTSSTTSGVEFDEAFWTTTISTTTTTSATSGVEFDEAFGTTTTTTGGSEGCVIL